MYHKLKTDYNCLLVNRTNYSRTNYYNNNQECTHHIPYPKKEGKPLRNHVSVSMHKAAMVSNNVGSRHVDYFPDQCDIRLVWTGGPFTWDQHDGNKEFNPFKTLKDYTGEIYPWFVISHTFNSIYQVAYSMHFVF